MSFIDSAKAINIYDSLSISSIHRFKAERNSRLNLKKEIIKYLYVCRFLVPIGSTVYTD